MVSSLVEQIVFPRPDRRGSVDNVGTEKLQRQYLFVCLACKFRHTINSKFLACASATGVPLLLSEMSSPHATARTSEVRSWPGANLNLSTGVLDFKSAGISPNANTALFAEMGRKATWFSIH
jgi:hypothetical protein